MFKKGVILILSLGLCALVSGDWSFYEGPWCAKDLIDVAVGIQNGDVIIYAVNSDYSLAKSTDEGQSWTILLTDVDIRCVTCNPNEADYVYIGRLSADGGIRYSSNGGGSWVQRNSGLPANFTPSAIAMRDAQHIVLGLDPHSADHYSIYYWDVNQWRPAIMSGGQTGFRITNLKWDPRNGLEEYIYASSDKVASGGNDNYIGVYRSEDYGHTWSQIGQPDPEQPGYMLRPEALSVCCALNGYIFAGYRPEGNNHNGGVMRTMDGGATWTRVLHQKWLPVTDVLGDPINPDKVYAAFGSGDYSYDGLGVYENMSSGEIALWHPFNQGLTDLYTNVLITFEVNFQHFLYLGTDNSFYVRNLNVFPNYWIERVKNMHPANVIAVEPRIPNFFAFSDKATYTSTNDGADWSTKSTVAAVSKNLSAEVHPSLNNEMLKWTEMHEPSTQYYLYHSNNGGLNWNSVYIEENDVIPPIPNIDYSYYSPERVYTFSNHDLAPQRYLLRSDNTGNTWQEYMTNFDGWITSVTCDHTPNSSDHLFIIAPFICYESTDGGSSWINRDLCAIYTWAVIRFGPTESSRLLVEYAADEYSMPFFTRTTNCGENWSHPPEYIPNHHPGPMTIDPEEPSIVYAAPFNPNTQSNDGFLSVDFSRVWITDNGGRGPFLVWDLEVDPNSPEYLYVGTNEGIYYYDPGFKNKHLTSSSDTATAYNSSRHLLRVHGTNEFWITYESGGAIYAVHSTDEGQTWSRKVEIGEGYNPAISIRDVPEYPPCIVWRTITGQDTIYFSQYISEEKWTAPTAIVTSQTGVDFGPPSFVIGTNNYGHVVYSATSATSSDIYCASFNVYNPGPVIPEDVGSGINPSIDFMTYGFGNPEIHVVWQEDGELKYRSKTGSNWNNEEFICYGSRPCIEVVSNVVHVVYEYTNNIWRRRTYYFGGGHGSWYGDQICSTIYPSKFPEITGGGACTWVEDLTGNADEIYFSVYDPFWGWYGPYNISNSPNELSNYPHIDHKQTVYETVLYFAWTENDNPIFDIEFVSCPLGGGGIDQGSEFAFLTAEGGEAEQSPFSVRREGYLQYGAEPYKKIDYDSEYLEYQFDGLNPEKEYALAAGAYQQGNANLPITIRIDNIHIGGIALPPETLITVKHMIPELLYEDSTINIKVFGNMAVSSALVLYEYETISTGGGGGPQSLGDLPLNFDSPIMSVFPNPVQKEINIQYTLFRETKVNLSIFDVAGRSVRNVISKNQISGTYHKSLSIANLPQGVYFIKLDTSDDAIVQKVIFIK